MMKDKIKERYRKKRYYERHKKEILDSRKTDEFRKYRREYEQTEHRKEYRKQYNKRKNCEIVE